MILLSSSKIDSDLEFSKYNSPSSHFANVSETKFSASFIDKSDFFSGTAHPDHRSIMNVTFNLADNDLLSIFLEDALRSDLYALKGHRAVGGARASIYNAMPMAGCEALVNFMDEFERTKG